MDNDNQNRNNTLTGGLPTDLWSLIADHLATDDKTLTLVNKQLLQAWRAGVLGIRLWGHELRDLDFLATEFGGNRNTALSFPKLRSLAFYDQEARFALPDRPYRFANSPRPQDLSLSLNLQTSNLVQGVLELARELPMLASRVTHLSVGDWGSRWHTAPGAPVSSDDLAELLAVFPNLEELTVVDMTFLNTESHASLPQPSAVKRLMIADCLNDCQEALTMSCPAVEELTLTNCFLDQHALWPVMARWPSLRKLCVISDPPLDDSDAYSSINDAHIDQLINTRLQLEELALTGCHEITPDKLAQLGAAQASLTTLTLQGARNLGRKFVGDRHLQALSGWPQLTSLTLSGEAAISDVGLHYLSQCAGLTELTIATSLGITGDGLVGDTPLFPKLQKLTVQQCFGDRVTGRGFKALLDNCPNLTHFNGMAVQSEDHDRALQKWTDKLQRRLQETRGAADTPSLCIDLRDFDVNERYFIVRALSIALKDSDIKVTVNLDRASSTTDED